MNAWAHIWSQMTSNVSLSFQMMRRFMVKVKSESKIYIARHRNKRHQDTTTANRNNNICWHSNQLCLIHYVWRYHLCAFILCFLCITALRLTVLQKEVVECIYRYGTQIFPLLYFHRSLASAALLFLSIFSINILYLYHSFILSIHIKQAKARKQAIQTTRTRLTAWNWNN